MQTLAERATGRDNNFDFIRWFAASIVIVSHESALLPNGGTEPLTHVAGGFATLGTIGVDIFFVVSGFLVTRSLLERRSLPFFAVSRVLRVVPGLAVALLFSAIVLGPLLTTLPLRDYLTNPAMRTYVTRNLNLLVIEPQWGLPGLFATNKHRFVVNGSLWSLWPEIQMYEYLLVLGVIGLLLPAHRGRVVGVGMVALAIFSWAVKGDLAGTSPEPTSLARLAPYFALGSLLYLLRAWVPFSLLLPALAWGAVALARGGPSFVPLFAAALALTVLWLAHARLGPLARWGRRGDFSYGLYIYAFPFQQALAAAFPKSGLAAHFTASYCLTLGCAIASWKLVESPALAWKSRLPFRGRSRPSVAL